MGLYASLSVLSISADGAAKDERIPVHTSPRVRRILEDFFLMAGLPADFTVCRDGQERPCLELSACAHEERVFADFNLSHSREALAVLVAGGARSRFRLGCDVECLETGRDRSGIARRFFSSQEYDWIAQAEGDEGLRRFMMLWTAKESWLKAHGRSVFDMAKAPVFSMEPVSPGFPLQFRQIFLCSPSAKSYVLTLALPVGLGSIALETQLDEGWRLSSIEQIYPAERPVSMVSPKR